MTQQDTVSSRRSCPRVGLRTVVLLCLNAAVVVVLGGSMVVEYVLERRAAIQRTRLSLTEEAAALKALLQREGDNPRQIQAIIDAVCNQMRQRSSPGHHIVVETGARIYQSSGHHEPSPGMAAHLKQAARRAGQADTPEGRLVVGHATGSGTDVYVSEFEDNIEANLSTVLRRRALTILALAVVLGTLVSLLASRLVHRPLQAVTSALERIRRGRLDTRLGCTGTREFQFLGEQINRMASRLEQAERARQTRMDRARRIQHNLLPDFDSDLSKTVAARYKPAEDVAGDTYDVVRLDDGRLLVAVVDVSGHGVGAAMGAAMLKALLNDAVDECHSAGQLLDRLNDGFLQVSLEDEFATAAVAVLDRDTGRLELAVAGHEAPLLVREDGRIEPVESSGMPLGIGRGTWETQVTRTVPGDRLVLYTDGLVDATNPAGDIFGRQRLVHCLGTDRHLPVDQAIGTVMNEVDRHRGEQPPHDDITLVMVETGPVNHP